MHYAEVAFRIVDRLNEALVFVTPDDEIQKVWQKALWDVIGRTVCVVILMYAEEIEPVVLLHARLEELDTSISPGSKEAFVTDIAETVQCELCISLLEEDGLDLDVVGFRGAAVVVDETRHLQEVESSQMPLLCGVSMGTRGITTCLHLPRLDRRGYRGWRRRESLR